MPGGTRGGVEGGVGRSWLVVVRGVIAGMNFGNWDWGGEGRGYRVFARGAIRIGRVGAYRTKIGGIPRHARP